jgi:hypothetical protein
MAFSCIHCKAVLGYSKDHVPLTDPFMRTRIRTLATVVVGMMLVSGMSRIAGRLAALGVIAAIAAFLAGAYFFSKKPAYEVISNRPTDANTKP